MIIKEYTGVGLNGYYDIYKIYNVLSKSCEEIQYYNPDYKDYMGKMNDPSIYPFNGIKINNLFKLDIHGGLEGVDEIIKLNVNVEIFCNRIMLIELVWEMTEFHKVFLNDSSNNKSGLLILAVRFSGSRGG